MAGCIDAEEDLGQDDDIGSGDLEDLERLAENLL
jgi:hypothetical protein